MLIMNRPAVSPAFSSRRVVYTVWALVMDCRRGDSALWREVCRFVLFFKLKEDTEESRRGISQGTDSKRVPCVSLPSCLTAARRENPAFFGKNLDNIAMNRSTGMCTLVKVSMSVKPRE